MHGERSHRPFPLANFILWFTIEKHENSIVGVANDASPGVSSSEIPLEEIPSLLPFVQRENRGYSLLRQGRSHKVKEREVNLLSHRMCQESKPTMKLTQKHMLRVFPNAEQKCGIHNALVYLVIREREKSYALCKLEVMPKGKQRLETLTLVKKNALLCGSQKPAKLLDSNLLFVRENALNILRLVTEYQNSQKPSKKVVTSKLGRENKHKKTRKDVSSRASSHGFLTKSLAQPGQERLKFPQPRSK